jgi:transglutaminase-like putative cysteine protease
MIVEGFLRRHPTRTRHAHPRRIRDRVSYVAADTHHPDADGPSFQKQRPVDQRRNQVCAKRAHAAVPRWLWQHLHAGSGACGWIEELPDDTLVYLLGSRYCDTQKLSDFAWQRFGTTTPGWGRVQAICDFVHIHITFGYANARDDRTAADGLQEGVGVCRDFTQLAIALCRCMNIPARYCTGYLGDIDVEPDPAPMDFSAWFEVYLGNRWFTFDARHNHPRIGRIVIARGRDAADVAISTSFGSATLEKFKIITHEVVSSPVAADPSTSYPSTIRAA